MIPPRALESTTQETTQTSSQHTNDENINNSPLLQMVYQHFHIPPFTNPPISHIASFDSLPKVPCPKCQKNRKYYCYDCCIPLIDHPPTISKLPLHCIIIQHKLERKTKSTAVQAKVVAHSSADLYEFPDIPSFITPSNSILVFPSKNAKQVRDLFKSSSHNAISSSHNTISSSHNNAQSSSHNNAQSSSHHNNENDINTSSLKYAVFIDSTWGQAKQIYRNELINRLPCVIIEEKETLFWRYQKEGQKFLSTIEAIYYFYKELVQAMNETLSKPMINDEYKYSENLENFLYYYIHQYCLIQEYYAKDPTRKITTKKTDNDKYIKYELFQSKNASSNTSSTLCNNNPSSSSNVVPSSSANLESTQQQQQVADSSVSNGCVQEPPQKKLKEQ
ncbi:hypothetical protein C9374_001277 [Naegleria lovaniensis]|uniref:tRNA-uridine aminocarboxypropyltransferase 1 n=1 Tax=Naegleria lovaniensis TaxID=51637 RepID=A0AA88KMK5_NAELO|nr:uncharacterized protein C9374_001277 [Naegleria lovaniensis]KAG2387683.1 hypothetical protein C9374_001277 [Naegleria lovaniensis]